MKCHLRLLLISRHSLHSLCLLTRDSAANADDADTCFAPLQMHAEWADANTAHTEEQDSAEVLLISLCYVEENNHPHVTSFLSKGRARLNRVIENALDSGQRGEEGGFARSFLSATLMTSDIIAERCARGRCANPARPSVLRLHKDPRWRRGVR